MNVTDLEDSLGKFLTKNGYNVVEEAKKMGKSKQAFYLQKLKNVRLSELSKIVGMDGVYALLKINPMYIHNMNIRIKDVV